MIRLKVLFLFCLLVSFTKSFSQVGIGTTSPNLSSVLDITSIDKGILIPRVHLADVTVTMLDGTNTAATGLLIYNTNSGVLGGHGMGYYYFNGVQWEHLSTSSTDTDHDFYGEGTTNAPNSINDDIYTLGNIAIGKNTADYALEVLEDTQERALNVRMTNSSNASQYGVYVENLSVGTGEHYGIRTEVSGSERIFGTYNDIYASSGSFEMYGTYNNLGVNGTGSGTKYGVYNNFENANAIQSIGLHNEMPYTYPILKIGVSNNLIGGVPIGIQNIIRSDNSTARGIDNQVEGFNSCNTYGIVNSISGNSFREGIASYNIIDPLYVGPQVGVYSEVLRTTGTSFAGFFRGKLAVGTTYFSTSTPDYYVLPTARGTSNQIMQTDGSGNVNWVDDTAIGSDDQTITYNATSGSLSIEDGNSVFLSTGDITAVTAGDGLIGSATTGTANINVVANNGITANSDDIVLGGALNQSTTISQGTYDMIFDLNASGDFSVQDNGTNHFEVRNSGLIYFGDDTYWNDGSTTGTTIARLYDGGTGDDGVFEIYKDGALQHQLNSSNTSVINELGQDFDFRIEGDSNPNLFYTDAGNDRLGFLTNSPSFDVHLVQSNSFVGGTGGMGFSAGSNNWNIYHSGLHFSFDENGTRRAYITAGTGVYVVTSDKRMKKDITEIESVLEKVNQLKAYRYLYKDQDTRAKKTIGFMAQDIQPLFPELVGETEDDYLGLNYAGFGVVAIKAIQEQQQIIDAQQQQLASLQKSQEQTNLLVQHLLERIEKLENKD